MDDKGITAERLMGELQVDFREMAEKMAATMNSAKAGRIIADTEEAVGDAHAEFRQRAYQKGLDLLAESLSQEAFSPSGERADDSVAEQGYGREPRGVGSADASGGREDRPG